jgi:hypothetical protein
MREIPLGRHPKANLGTAEGRLPQGIDPVLQSVPGPNVTPPPLVSFEGVNNVNGVLPPDTNGDVGPNHYVQMVNLSFAIWDRSGTLLLGPVNSNTLWSGFGGPCQTTNDGDPIVLYDHLADRWLMSQFAVSDPSGFFQCIAISQTGDPTGSWHRYAFLMSTVKFNDYPKFGVWPDAYYMSVNQFLVGFDSVAAVAFERDQMLLGNPAQMVIFDLQSVEPNRFSLLPGDLDGPPPAPGTPNPFLAVEPAIFGWPTDQLSEWDFFVDWVTPANSTFGVSGSPNQTLPTAPFDANMCGFSRNCIPQPGGTPVDALSSRLMNRVQFRDFGTHQVLMANHTVDVDGTDHAGVRWYELQNTGGGWFIAQQGTYAPDSDHRWMGSVAMDGNGNIAVGYSVSSSSTFPSIRYATRVPTDPLGTLQAEAQLIGGSGTQSHSSGRWGDYSMMAVDPIEQCTFWYTQQYYQTTGTSPWQTRIGKFILPCVVVPVGTLEGTVTNAFTTDPISGAQIEAIGPSTRSTLTDGSGFYQFLNLPVATYDVTASAFGFFPDTVLGVVVLDGVTTTQDFALTPTPTTTVQGTVTDGSGHGWPLYARIDISGVPDPVFTDPVTGAYSVELPSGSPVDFTVNAVGPGYNPEVRSVTAPSIEDFALTIDTVACTAPGYGGGLSEQFETGSLPPGWSIVDNLATGDVWRFDDPGARGNLTGGSGGFAIVDSDWYTPSGFQDTELITPSMDFSGAASVLIQFDYDFFWYDFGLDEIADVDVSTNGGASWTNVFRRQGASDRGPQHAVVDITGLAAGQPNVLVRFHYYQANWEFWWQVDNVQVGPGCELVPGGLLVGNVRDANSGAGLNGATVTSDDAPSDTTTTFATPDDPAVDEGLYILFSSLTGAHPFTASISSGYGTDTQVVAVVADSIVPQDFALPAGSLSVDPPALEVTIPLGSTTTRELALTNNGGLPATFEILEAEGAPPPSPIPMAALQAKAREFSQPAPVGEASVRSLEQQRAELKKSPRPGPLVWTGASPLPGGLVRYAHAQCSESPDSFYVISGVDGGFSVTPNAWRYDAGSDTWNALAPFPVAVEAPTAACFGGRLYVMGGGGTNQHFIYDIASDVWASGAAVPRLVWGAAAGAWEGRVYLIGGDDDFFIGGTSNQVDIYDIATDTWIGTGTPMPAAAVTPGFVQAGQHVYLAGGWNDASPTSNVNVTQRYDMAGNTWTTGPAFGTARSDLALAATAVALYAIGGDADGGGFFDPTTMVERLDLAAWPGGLWADIFDPIPVAFSANNAGFCTAAVTGGEVWSVGGANAGIFGDNQYRPTGEACFTSVDVPWLSEVPDTGTIAPSAIQPITVTFDASAVPGTGTFDAQLIITDDTPSSSLPPVGVRMNVTGSGFDPVPEIAALTPESVFAGAAELTLRVKGYDFISSSVVRLNGFDRVTVFVNANEVTATIPAGDVASPGAAEIRVFNPGAPGDGLSNPASLNILSPPPSGSDVLFGAAHLGPNGMSSLYSIDPATGAPTLIGPIGFERVSAMDVGPDGSLYATGERADGSNIHVLITIDRATGAGTEVGPTGVEFLGFGDTVSDISFRHSDGALYAYLEAGDGLGTIDPATGAATALGPTGTASCCGNGIAFSPLDGLAPTSDLAQGKGAPRPSPIPMAALQAKARQFSQPAPVGPGSVRSLAEQPREPQQFPQADPLVWIGASPLPGGLARYAHAQCSESPDSFYVISGVDGGFSVTPNAWRYDAGSDTWNALAPFPVAVEAPTAACFGGRLYVMGGSSTNQHFIYDIASDTWAPGAAVPRLVVGAAAGAWEGRVYLMGGDDDFFAGGTSNQVNIYDIATDTWIGTGTVMPAGAWLPGFVQAGQHVYLAGGWGDATPAANANATQRYDMASNAWTVGPVFTSARGDLALATTAVALYAIGGDADGGGFFDPTNTVERLDLAAWPGGSWTNIGDPIPTAFSANNAGFCTAAVTGGEVWSVGGLSAGGIFGDNQYRPTGEACFSTVPAGDSLWHATENPLNTLDQTTGAATFVTNLIYSPPADNFPRINGMDFVPVPGAQPGPGTLFGSLNDGTGFGGTRENYVATIDTATGVVTILGPTVDGLDALAFGTFGPRPPLGRVDRDFDADGKADLAIWRPSNGLWFILPSGSPGTFIVRQWGVSGDIAVPGDYDGDGQTDLAIWRPSTGVWFILPSGSPGTFIVQQWGVSGDIPVARDYDGDGQTDLAIWRPSIGKWFILPSSSPGTFIARQWGVSTDIPAPGDYDGDGQTDLAIWRPSNGLWFILPSGSPGTFIARQWGVSGDKPAPGDYDGDGQTDLAIWRPSTGVWFILPSGAPGTFTSTNWGVSGDIPVPRNYDGDTKTDLAVWRPSTGVWFILPSGAPGTFTATQWGVSTDENVNRPEGQ